MFTRRNKAFGVHIKNEYTLVTVIYQFYEAMGVQNRNDNGDLAEVQDRHKNSWRHVYRMK